MVWNKCPTEHKKLYKHLSLFWYLPHHSLVLPWFTLVLRYSSINFSSISLFFLFSPLRYQQAKHTGSRTAQTHTSTHPKTSSFAGNPELPVHCNTHTSNFPILQGQRSCKMPIMASRWQPEPFMEGMGSAPNPELQWLWASAQYG